MSGDRVRLVLRNRQQVEAALVDFHDELNHLNVNKCLRLLNERYFWKTMKFDVMEWINSCSQCSLKMVKKAHGAEAEHSEMLLQTLQSPDPDSDSSGKDEDSEDACGDEDDDDDDDDGGGGAGVMEEQQVIESVEEMSQEAPPPSGLQPRIPILIHLRTPNNLQPNASVILQPRTPNQPLITRFWSVNMGTPDPSENPSEGQPGNQTSPQTTEPEEQRGTGTRTRHFIQSQDAATPLTEPTQHPPQSQNGKRRTKKSSEPPAQRSDRPPAKRRRTTEPEPSAVGGSCSGLDPVVAPSTKPWPVFTIA
ncbi:acidic proline-rich protein PRP33, partial [Nematolebias whitei]|uniref:acidic proline-rich protein PRP33 n=1 Tax=Nematolebias whitei TaxID=451745 RepID=UPI00189B7CD1